MKRHCYFVVLRACADRRRWREPCDVLGVGGGTNAPSSLSTSFINLADRFLLEVVR